MDSPDRTRRQKVLEAVDGERLSGFETLGRLTAKEGTDPVEDGQAFLYPALHWLEANGRLKAEWSVDSSGRLRRLYRRLRLPFGPA